MELVVLLLIVVFGLIGHTSILLQLRVCEENVGLLRSSSVDCNPSKTKSHTMSR